jgi:hypothetical protein
MPFTPPAAREGLTTHLLPDGWAHAEAAIDRIPEDHVGRWAPDAR